MKELTILHKVLISIDRGQGIGIGGSIFSTVDKIFNKRFGTRLDDLEILDACN